MIVVLTVLGYRTIHVIGRLSSLIGVLSFFYDTDTQPWGYDPADRSGHGIYLFDPGELQRLPAPDAEAALAPMFRSVC